MRLILASMLVMCAAASSAIASDDDALVRTAKAIDCREINVGRLAPPLSGRTIDGKDWVLPSAAATKVSVLAFTSSTCPVSRKYLPTLTELQSSWSGRGVEFILINSSEGEDIADIRKQLAACQLACAYLIDADHRLAVALDATTTAEVFVLDAARTIVYRGAIDDQYSLGQSLDAPRHTYLVDALNATLTGAQPLVRATSAPGCVLESPGENTAQAAAPMVITWHNRISRIVQDNCMTCHRSGGVGPFALETYDQVKSRSNMLRRVVDAGIMPPWFASPTPADGHSPWKNDRTLSDADKADLLAWLGSADKPEGDAQDAPLPRTYPDTWSIGEPDAVLRIPKPIEVKADGVMNYIHLRVDTNFDEDHWVQAIEVLPSARQVVHHVLVFVVPKSETGDEKLRDAIDETRGFFAAYVPGNSAAVFPEGFAKLLPKDSTLIFQLHYTPNGKATTDQTRIAFRFAKDKPQHIVRVAGIAQHRLRIPPNDPDHVETASLNVPFDVHVLSFMPHMHVRGKSFRYEAKLPDGSTKTMLDVPRYDFNWQLRYELREPLMLPADSTINVTATYDNSADNPANPDPGKQVRWGPQTTDEMMLGYVEYYADAEDGQTGFSPSEQHTGGASRDLASADRFDRLLKLLDRNNDQIIARDEVPDRLTRQFNNLDRNNDGRVTRDEMP